MKLTSPKTYRIIRFALEHPSFRQVEASEATGVSLGLVSRVTNWLVAHRFASKNQAGFRVLAPAALAESLALFRQMKELKTASFNVQLTEDELKELLVSNDAVLCLTSALQRFDDYFRDPSIHAYAGQGTVEKFSALPPGRTSITIYRDDLNQPDDFETEGKSARQASSGVPATARRGKGGLRFTKPVRTIIDVLCSERAYAAEQMIKKNWGTNQ